MMPVALSEAPESRKIDEENIQITLSDVPAMTSLPPNEKESESNSKGKQFPEI